ncbi:MAG: hypothetical protein LBK08_00790 [Treponema sp.]|nr:hypothetical protein [Treponema sp.]
MAEIFQFELYENRFSRRIRRLYRTAAKGLAGIRKRLLHFLKDSGSVTAAAEEKKIINFHATFR